MYQYRGILTEDDHVEITRLRRSLTRQTNTAIRWTFRFGASFVVIALWAYIGNPRNVTGVFSWLILAALCLAYWLLRRPDLSRESRGTTALREEHQGRVTEIVLEVLLAGTETRLPWKLFTAHLASQNAIVLLLGTQIHIPLARRLFGSDEDWQAASGIIHRQVQQLKSIRETRLRAILFWLLVAVITYMFWSVSSSLRQ